MCVGQRSPRISLSYSQSTGTKKMFFVICTIKMHKWNSGLIHLDGNRFYCVRIVHLSEQRRNTISEYNWKFIEIFVSHYRQGFLSRAVYFRQLTSQPAIVSTLRKPCLLPKGLKLPLLTPVVVDSAKFENMKIWKNIFFSYYSCSQWKGFIW